jgi:hypothetical protein
VAVAKIADLDQKPEILKLAPIGYFVEFLLRAVNVKGPAESHQLTVSRLQSWLESAGKSPNEQALKSSLRALLKR